MPKLESLAKDNKVTVEYPIGENVYQAELELTESGFHKIPGTEKLIRKVSDNDALKNVHNLAGARERSNINFMSTSCPH